MRAHLGWLSTRKYQWLALCSLLLVLQACGGGNNFNNHPTGNGNSISTNNAAQFSGNILFVQKGNMLILNGKDSSLTTLTQDGTAVQPSISPNGSTIAFELRKPTNDYSDIAIMPITGGKPTMITDNSLHNKSSGQPYHYLFWAGNPIWTADGKHIIYLSDYFKGGATTPFYPNPTCPGNSGRDWILDMGIVELPASARPVPGGQMNNPPKLLSWPYCYAGGDQDLSLRPGTRDTEVLFTSFQYSGPKLDLVAQMSLLVIPADGGNSKLIQLSPPDPKVIPLEPSFSPDGKYITYIRRENGQDDLYIMPIPATVTGTPNQESYGLEGNGTSVYSTNTSYYAHSQKLASGIIGNPVWGANNTLFFMMFNNGEFDLYMAKVKFSTPASTPTPTTTPGATPTTTPAPAAPVITLDGAPVQLTQGGIDGQSRPVWFQ
jgi:Tol biopolymer transport system component